MPYLNLNTSKKLSDQEKLALCAAIGELMPLIPGKTRENTMMHIEDGQFMRLGSDEPCLYLEVRLFKPAPFECKEDFVKQISALLEQKLGVAQGKMYINLVEMDTWGSNGGFRK